MNLRSALATLNIQWPRTKKLRCPHHHDKTASLHLYEQTNSWYCYSCGANGDAYGLIAAISGTHVNDVLARYKNNDKVTVKPAKSYLLKERLNVAMSKATQPLFTAIRMGPFEEWQKELLLARASDWYDEERERLAEMPPYELERALPALEADALELLTLWHLEGGDDET